MHSYKTYKQRVYGTLEADGILVTPKNQLPIICKWLLFNISLSFENFKVFAKYQSIAIFQGKDKAKKFLNDRFNELEIQQKEAQKRYDEIYSHFLIVKGNRL